MTKEKWQESFDKEWFKANIEAGKLMEHNPENWEIYKDILLKFVKDVDQATEVYNMENRN